MWTVRSIYYNCMSVAHCTNIIHILSVQWVISGSLCCTMPFPQRREAHELSISLYIYIYIYIYWSYTAYSWLLQPADGWECTPPPLWSCLATGCGACGAPPCWAFSQNAWCCPWSCRSQKLIMLMESNRNIPSRSNRIGDPMALLCSAVKSTE